MPDFGDTLSKQVGPLPVGGWILAVAGGLGVAYFINRDARGPAPDFDPGADGGLGSTGFGRPGTDLPGSGAPPAMQPAPDSDDGDGPSTNAGWAVLAIREGVALGFGPLAVNIAVSRYLTGQPLSSAQAKIIDTLLTELGPPPNPVPTPTLERPPSGGGSGGQTPTTPPKPTTPPPTPPPRSPPPAPSGTSSLRTQIRAIFDKYGLSVTTSRLDRLVREVQEGRTLADIDANLKPFASGGSSTSPGTSSRTYTIVKGDTLWAIAQRFYGAGSQWPKLWAANSSTLRSGNPNLIYPGERIVIP